MLRRVEVRDRIDDVQLAVGPEAVEHEHGVLAPQRTDLDHALGLDGVENGRDDELPERKHDWLATPEVGRKAQRYQQRRGGRSYCRRTQRGLRAALGPARAVER